MKERFEAIKAICSEVTGEYAPWWVVPLALVTLIALIF